jgi:tetratricopeptide (TPR) repeat protein
MKARYYLAALILSWGSLNADANATENTNEAAIEIAKSLIDEDWNNTKAHNDLGEVYLKLGNIKKAEKEFKSALETDPVYSIGPFMFGDVRTDAERYQSKIEDFKKVIAQNEEYARAHHNLGTVWLAQNNPEIAKREYEEALKINPEYAQAHNGLGLVYEDLGQKDKAMEQFELALAIDENNVAANYNIGLSYQDRNDLNTSIFYLAKARELYKQRKNDSRERYLGELIAHMEKTYVRPDNETQTTSIEPEYPKNALAVSIYEEPKTHDSSQSSNFKNTNWDESVDSDDMSLADESTSSKTAIQPVESPIEEPKTHDSSQSGDFKNINWDESIDSDDMSLADEGTSSKNAIQSVESPIVSSGPVYGPHMPETPVSGHVIKIMEVEKKVQPETASINKETIDEHEPEVKILKVKTSGGDFLGNRKVVSSVFQRSEPVPSIDTESASDSIEQSKHIAKKEPKKKQDEPFVGDWLFEYQNK